MTSSWLPPIEKNRVNGHSKIKKRITGRNRVISHSGMKLEMEDANSDLSNVRLSIEK